MVVPAGVVVPRVVVGGAGVVKTVVVDPPTENYKNLNVIRSAVKMNVSLRNG